MSESKTKEYEDHELASIFPLIEGEEFESLVEDIKEKGQLEDGILFEGKILDGRNRYRACKLLGIPFKAEEYSSDITPMDYIISTNLHRRHLTVAQRAEIGMLLYDDVEKEVAKKRADRVSEALKKKSKVDEIKDVGKILPTSRDYEKELKETTAYKVAQKVKVKPHTIEKAKKIKEVAKKDKYIAEQWEEAKRGDSSIDAVYKKARVIESIVDLPKQQQDDIKKVMDSEDKSTKQIKADVQDIKDNMKRADIAKRNRESAKKREEMERLHLKIKKLKITVIELEGAYKSSQARLVVLADEAVEKYPDIKSAEPDFVITYLDGYYDTLDVGVYDKQLKELRDKYNALEKPLRDKLAVLEGERSAKKEVIDKQKKKKNNEAVWVEAQQNRMAKEYNKQELFEENIKKHKKEVKELQDKYDDK